MYRRSYKIALSSNDDKRLQTYDKITTYPHGTPAIKVCESEILSKNKLNMLDEDKNTPKDKNKDKTTPKTKAKTIHKTKDNDEDNDKTIPKTKDNDEDIDKDKDEAMSKCIDENMLTKVYFEEEKKLIDNNHWTRKKTVKSFGIIILYLKYVKSGYSIVITMHT